MSNKVNINEFYDYYRNLAKELTYDTKSLVTTTFNSDISHDELTQQIVNKYKVGNCYDFSILLRSKLRSMGIRAEILIIYSEGLHAIYHTVCMYELENTWYVADLTSVLAGEKHTPRTEEIINVKLKDFLLPYLACNRKLLNVIGWKKSKDNKYENVYGLTEEDILKLFEEITIQEKIQCLEEIMNKEDYSLISNVMPFLRKKEIEPSLEDLYYSLKAWSGMTLSESIQYWRNERNLTVDEFAILCGLDSDTIIKIENNVSNISQNDAYAILDVIIKFEEEYKHDLDKN